MIKKVLVPLDGSEVSESILPQVIALAKPLKAKVVLLQAREPLERGVRETMGEDLAHKLDTVTMEEVRGYLNKVADDLKGQDIQAEIAVAEGRAAEAILEYVATNAVDLVAMATHGRSGFTRLAFGSVAEKVLRQSPVPVLLNPVSGRA